MCNGRSGAHAVCAYPVSPDARSPGAWKVATGRVDVRDPPGARIGIALVPLRPPRAPDMRRTERHGATWDPKDQTTRLTGEERGRGWVF